MLVAEGQAISPHSKTLSRKPSDVPSYAHGYTSPTISLPLHHHNDVKLEGQLPDLGQCRRPLAPFILHLSVAPGFAVALAAMTDENAHKSNYYPMRVIRLYVAESGASLDTVALTV